MWDMQAAIPFGRLSKRNILLFVASVIATTFAYLFVAATPVYAADAKWEQGSIVYQDTTFRGPTQPNERAGHDLPTGTSLYTNLDGSTLKVLYFPAGSDPATVTSATYITYSVNNSGQLSNKSDPTSVTIDATTSDQANQATNPSSSSCKVDGIGWIVCPVTNFLATGMDWVFGILSSFVEVQPLETTTDSTMHRIWEIMRNFANVAFVIAFLIIIYSQLTSVGLTNYGIKKLLPRIIVAAILVNVSYWICTLAIDISNILGYSLQGIFLGLRDTVMSEGGGSGWQQVSWENIASFILAGGAVGGAAIAGVVLSASTMGAFTVGGVILLLLPILLGAFLTVLVVLFILAARQAIIVLLVIISPLALVAYLLPNTEKWFEKWRGLFMTMLIFFPAFSLVFGGAQFAGLMIINAAVAKGDINMILLGMAVQIAPLAITPLLLKLSGTLLSRIGGLINDPSRGLKDRTKNWSKDRLAARKAGEDAKTRTMMQNGTLGKRHVVRRTALGLDTRRRLREGQKSVNETRATSMFNDTNAGSALNQAEREAEREKSTIQNKLEGEWNIKAKIDPTSLDKELKLRVTADEANLAKLKMDSVYEEIKTGDRGHLEAISGHNLPLNGPQQNADAARRVELLNRAVDTTSYLAVEGMRKNTAEGEQKSNIAKQLTDNIDMVDGKNIREYAGGIEGAIGAQRALASAYSTTLGSYEENIKNAGTIINHGNYQDSQITKLINGDAGTTGIAVTEDIRIAAARKIAGGKNADEIVNMLRTADIPNMSQDLRQEMGEALLANGATPKWLGAGAKAAIKQGDVNADGDQRIHGWIVDTIKQDKLSSAETLVNQDKTYLKEVHNTLSNPDARKQIGLEQITALKKEIYTSVLHDTRYSGRIGERDKYLGDIYKEISKVAPEAGPSTYEEAKRVPPEDYRP